MRNESCLLSSVLGAAAVAMCWSTGAAAQTPAARLNLQVRNVDLADSCVHPGFRPELKIVNWGTSPFVLTQAVVRMFFNNPRSEAIEFVNADFVRVFNPDGSLTGVFATAFHFEGPPPSPACVATPARVANQRHFIAFQALGPALVTIPPNGGFATIIVALRRGGGLAPFDAGCDDFSKLQLQDPARPFRDDAFFNLVEASGTGVPSRLICEASGPTTADPLTGLDPCSNTTGCTGP
jgi:hypothetical protein